MKKIHIFHNHWQEICSLNKNNTIIYRNNNEEGNSFLELHYLKITWKNYEKPDYFFSNPNTITNINININSK